MSTIPNDWNQLDFATPYSWDTSMNLLVDICVGPMTVPNTAGLGNDPVAMMDGTAIQKADDIINVCGGNATTFYEYYQRPVIRFNYCPSPVLPFEFTWKPGTYLNDSNAQNPTAYVANDIKYAVYTIGRNGCKVRDSLTITVPKHTLNLWAQDTFACVQQPVYMHASGADAYQWFEYQGGVFASASGSLSCTTCDNPTALPKVTTTYAVIFTNNVHQSNPLNSNYETGCPDTLFTTVNIWPLPNVVSSNNDTTITFGQSVQLYARGASHYSWTPVGSLSDPNSPAPIAAPTTTTNYVVSGMDTNGCVSRDTVTVYVNYNDNLLIPSAFTPNGDGRNDEFRIVNATFQRLMEFRVFNRWGQEVFSTTDIRKGWDGTWKGVPQDMGAYQYLIRVAYPDGRVETYKGDVSIVK
jgi:gliding motility-associated-like protein